MELNLYETQELYAEIISSKRTRVGISSEKRSLFVDSRERPYTGGWTVYSFTISVSDIVVVEFVS